MKTLAIAAALFAATQSRAALPISPTERARVFAECTGRYSATADHQRLMGGSISERTETMRDLFATMLDAVTPDAIAYGLPKTHPMAWRVEAKANHAALLAASVFNMIPARAEPARAAAARHMAQCDGLILGT